MRLERLLRPRSIAAIGGLQASRVVEQSLLMGYTGDIWPIHPSKEEVHGLKAYRLIEDLPGAPDAAFIGVNRHLTIEVVRRLRDIGCGGGVCFAAGFREADQTGGELQSDLIEAAGEMPLLGPNCYGYINYADGALLWPDQQGGKRLDSGRTGVAIIAQSSNIAINFTMQKRGLPLAYIFTVGNQALVGISELALNLLEDPRVTTLGIYIEGFDSIAAFEELGRKAREMNKPVVIFKVGRSAQAQASAMSHTASLVGAHAVSSEFLRRNGFGQADSIPVFLETLKLLHLHGPLPGYRVSSMSCSGGEASIIADAAAKRKVYFPGLDAKQKAPLQEALGPLVAIANPLDYHTYSWANREVMEATYTAMTGIGFDMNYLILDFPHSTRCDDREWHIAVDAFEAALRRNQARGAFVVGMPENIPEEYTENYSARGIVSFYGIDEALHATEIAADIGFAWQHGPPAPVLALEPLSGKPVTLDEADAKQQLQAVGVPVPAGGRIDSIESARLLAANLGYPLVLKALGIAHKTEHNAVRLGLASSQQVDVAASELFELSDRLYLEAMKPALAELIVGVTRDIQFGLVLTIGSGGILVELLQDARTLLIPASRDEIETALAELRSAPLLRGYRGRPRADIDAAVDAILAVQEYAISRAGSLIELDVNPLLVGAQGQGVFAGDALIVLEEQK
ncbi:MAG: acetate--CoA ligase family protein [Gammaproteobacteria bacterium]|nr:acetate--CoA ligase family protein [Gammaproteobacteria bacterium]MDH3449269.1 acetate--CoA ligase family protein [Gammaproteobacteria bacterium]